ncbi:unnamed protein product [Arabidopsis halleri]
MGPPPEASQFYTVADLLIPDSREWNIPLIQTILPDYVEEIQAIIPSKKGTADKWAWLPSSSGDYTAKSGYYEAFPASDAEETLHQQNNMEEFNWRKSIWNALKLLCLPPTGVGDGPLAPWIIWSIWTARNQLIFNKKRISFEEALLVGIIRAREWQEAQRSLHPKPKPTRTSTCALPPTSEIKIFTDAAWKGNGSAGLGWISRTNLI